MRPRIWFQGYIGHVQLWCLMYDYGPGGHRRNIHHFEKWEKALSYILLLHRQNRVYIAPENKRKRKRK